MPVMLALDGSVDRVLGKVNNKNFSFHQKEGNTMKLGYKRLTTAISLAILCSGVGAQELQFAKGPGGKLTLGPDYPSAGRQDLSSDRASISPVQICKTFWLEPASTDKLLLRKVFQFGSSKTWATGHLRKSLRPSSRDPVPKSIFPQHLTVADFNALNGKSDIFSANFGWDRPPWSGEKSVLMLSNADGTPFGSKSGDREHTHCQHAFLGCRRH